MFRVNWVEESTHFMILMKQKNDNSSSIGFTDWNLSRWIYGDPYTYWLCWGKWMPVYENKLYRLCRTWLFASIKGGICCDLGMSHVVFHELTCFSVQLISHAVPPRIPGGCMSLFHGKFCCKFNQLSVEVTWTNQNDLRLLMYRWNSFNSYICVRSWDTYDIYCCHGPWQKACHPTSQAASNYCQFFAAWFSGWFTTHMG